MDLFCSTIIPTVNRPTLPRAVCSVLDQTLHAAGFEVIVVNDSGQPLPEMDWVHSDRVQVINTNRRERSVARNTGAAIARGKYLNFLDDDDLLLPGALEAFWNLARARKAIWLSGGWQTIGNDGKLVNEFCASLKGNIFALLVAGEGLPCGASLYDHEEFFASGGFDPQIVGVEDRDLGRRMALRGDINSTDKIVARIRIGEQGSTTVWSTLPEKDRWGREKALMQKGASSRLRKSANSNYLRGRACRALVASMVWNVRHRNGFAAASRAATTLALAGFHPLAPGFWDGYFTKIKS